MSVKSKNDENEAITAGIAADADTREMGDADFRRTVSVGKLPISARKAIAGVRGKQKKPTKIATTIRLDPDVIEYYKAAGPGWQRRINNDLVRQVHGFSKDVKTRGEHGERKDSKSGLFISRESEKDDKKRA